MVTSAKHIRTVNKVGILIIVLSHIIHEVIRVDHLSIESLLLFSAYLCTSDELSIDLVKCFDIPLPNLKSLDWYSQLRLVIAWLVVILVPVTCKLLNTCGKNLYCLTIKKKMV